MTAPATEAPASQTITIGPGNPPALSHRDRRSAEFPVFSGGRRVGTMWRTSGGRWRAHRDGHGATAEDYPSQEQAAAAVRWVLTIPAGQIPWRAAQPMDYVRLVSPAGDVAIIQRAGLDDDRQRVYVTAVLTGELMLQASRDPGGGAAAVRHRVAQQFGGTCIGGGAPGTTGDPVALFTMPADQMVTLLP